MPMLRLFSTTVQKGYYNRLCGEVQALASLYTLPNGSVNVQVCARVSCVTICKCLSSIAACFAWVLLTWSGMRHACTTTKYTPRTLE